MAAKVQTWVNKDNVSTSGLRQASAGTLLEYIEFHLCAHAKSSSSTKTSHASDVIVKKKRTSSRGGGGPTHSEKDDAKIMQKQHT